MQEEFEQELFRQVLFSFEGKAEKLIPILHRVQDNYGYLPEEAISPIATFLNITAGQVYSVASFYDEFRLTPLGKNRVTVCRGTACHIRGAPQILESIEQLIDIKDGETRDDLEYTLESVACIGCCALAPCLKINRDVHGEVSLEKVRGFFPTADEGVRDG
ncbi:NADH-quinone oxidoreductase subunit NuoE [Chloroflexota bacterium]